MKVVCIVQARMGSSRLPGKVLKEICGKSVLEHVIYRLRLINNIDEIIIATTNLERDNQIIKECEKIGVKYFRGSEDNVLSRYYYAAKENNADIVVRITSDCPLIDYKISQDIIQYYLDNAKKYDYISNTIERTYPRGLDTEVFSFNALEVAFKEAVSNRDLEHVTPYIWDNSKVFKIAQYKNDKDYSELRWTLDTKEDLELIENIYENLYNHMNSQFVFEDILNLYNQYPELYNMNKHIMQKHI
ncbi:cytidylyltransferase domain-containing protein [Clostridium taeniosporum]|uniref:Acylneuraminate cytidylyltransferase n=1 Tax=Clostridium taeniosporum TaxID=394958 RepID=A0A1D7XHU5_9CLOT|nr:glycosyltransferase family protein [Clostridium taeniosporum]AOR22913.1 acylneuraminate cytidylyltransferase [Clostridium taeniosporum]